MSKEKRSPEEMLNTRLSLGEARETVQSMAGALAFKQDDKFVLTGKSRTKARKAIKASLDVILKATKRLP
jgi:hypothetical protein